MNANEPRGAGIDGEGSAPRRKPFELARKRAVLLSLALEEPHGVRALEGDVVGFCGFEREQFRDPAFGFSRMHPEDLARLPELRRSMEEEGRAAWDCRWLHADRRYRQFHVELEYYRDEQGVPVEVLACVVRRQRGKTSRSARALCARILEEQRSQWGSAILSHAEERRAVTAALRASENRFRTLFDEAPHGVLVCWEGRFLEANGTICRMLGYTREELLALRFNDLEVGLSAEEVFRTLRDQKEKPVTFLGRHRRKDGTEYTAEVRVGPIVHDGSSARLAIVRDVSEVQELSDSLVLRTAALEETSDGILITGSRAGGWPVLFASHSFEMLSGLAREQMTGKCTLEILWPENRSGLVCGEVTAALTAAQGYQGELHVPWHGGGGCWLFVRIKPLLSGNGGGVRFIWWFVDITAQKRAEEEAAAQRESLMRMGRLASVGEVSVHIAHQLGQPLSAMVGNLEAARAHVKRTNGGDPVLQEVLDDLSADCRRLQETLQRVGSLVRPEVSVPEEVLLGHLVTGVLAMLRREVLSRHVSVRTSLAPGLPPVFADRVQIQQVIMNLLTNAFDAVEGLPVEARVVEVTVQATDAGIELAVLDRGHGIEPEHVGRIFDPLFSTKVKGWGMGLCLCRSIAELHGGRLAVENRSGGGAVFRFVLPALQSKRPLPHEGGRGR